MKASNEDLVYLSSLRDFDGIRIFLGMPSVILVDASGDLNREHLRGRSF